MALDTYTGLLSALATFAVRTDQTALWPDCVALAEAQIEREVRVRPMMAREPLTIDAEFETVPADMIGPVSFSLDADPAVHLQHVAPENVAHMKETPDAFTGSDECGNAWDGPRWYALVGDEFQFFPAPEASYTGELTYWQRIPALASNASNWLLARHPDAYLYGALVQFGQMAGDERISGWLALYQRAIEAIRQAYPTETNKAQLRTEFPFPRCY